MVKFQLVNQSLRLLRDATPLANVDGQGYNAVYGATTVLYGTVPYVPDRFYTGTNSLGWFFQNNAAGGGGATFASGYSGGCKVAMWTLRTAFASRPQTCPAISSDDCRKSASSSSAPSGRNARRRRSGS